MMSGAYFFRITIANMLAQPLTCNLVAGRQQGPPCGLRGAISTSCCQRFVVTHLEKLAERQEIDRDGKREAMYKREG